MSDSTVQSTVKSVRPKSQGKEKNSRVKKWEERPAEIWKAKTSCFRKNLQTDEANGGGKDIRVVEVKDHKGVPYTLTVDVFWQANVDKNETPGDNNCTKPVVSSNSYPSCEGGSHSKPNYQDELTIGDMWPDQGKILDQRVLFSDDDFLGTMKEKFDSLIKPIQVVSGNEVKSRVKTVDVGVSVNMSQLLLESNVDVSDNINSDHKSFMNRNENLDLQNALDFIDGNTKSGCPNLVGENLKMPKSDTMGSRKNGLYKCRVLKPCCVKINYNIKKFTQQKKPTKTTKDDRKFCSSRIKSRAMVFPPLTSKGEVHPSEPLTNACKLKAQRVKSVDPQTKCNLYTLCGQPPKAAVRCRSESVKRNNIGRGEPVEYLFDSHSDKPVKEPSNLNKLSEDYLVDNLTNDIAKQTIDISKDLYDKVTPTSPLSACTTVLQMESQYDQLFGPFIDENPVNISSLINPCTLPIVEKECALPEKPNEIKDLDTVYSIEEEKKDPAEMAEGKSKSLKIGKTHHVKWKHQSSRVSCLVQVPGWQNKQESSANTNQFVSLKSSVPAFKTRSVKVRKAKRTFTGWR